MQRLLRQLVLTTTIFSLPALSLAADETDCHQALLRAAGRYQSCELGVLAKSASDEGFRKCRQKYVNTWSKLASRFPASSCDQPRFVDNGDGTVSDNLTHLVWEKKTPYNLIEDPADPHDSDRTFFWSLGTDSSDGSLFTDFLAVLNSTGEASQHDWRIPTLAELHTLLTTAPYPCGALRCTADPLFSDSFIVWFWTSSIMPGTTDVAEVVAFGAGQTLEAKRNRALAVRAVRGGF